VTTFLLVVAAFLVLNVGAGMVRVARGPSPADRMLAAQLFGTTGVAVLLVLAEATATHSLRDVALVFALLAVVLSVAFVKRGWIRAHDTPGDVAGDGIPTGDEAATAGAPADGGEPTGGGPSLEPER
jgi:multicomponent Na+:H+ antiporter subunit F